MRPNLPCLLALGVLAAPTSVFSSDVAVVGQLVSALGITESQATGGTAAIFDYVESELDGDDWGRLVTAVPAVRELTGGVDDGAGEPDLLAAAGTLLDSGSDEPGSDGADDETASGGSALGTAASLLGTAAAATGDDDVGSAAAMASLAGSFSDLGLDGDMVQRFVPIVVDWVSGEGGGESADLVKLALGLL